MSLLSVSYYEIDAGWAIGSCREKTYTDTPRVSLKIAIVRIREARSRKDSMVYTRRCTRVNYLQPLYSLFVCLSLFSPGVRYLLPFARSFVSNESQASVSSDHPPSTTTTTTTTTTTPKDDSYETNQRRYRNFVAVHDVSWEKPSTVLHSFFQAIFKHDAAAAPPRSHSLPSPLSYSLGFKASRWLARFDVPPSCPRNGKVRGYRLQVKRGVLTIS